MNMTLRSNKSKRTGHAWQLEFLKTASPEMVVAAFLDLFEEQGLRLGSDWEISRELIETVDYELCSGGPAAKKAVQALVQTLIACRRFVKATQAAPTVAGTASATSTKSTLVKINQGSKGAQGLGLQMDAPSSASSSTTTTTIALSENEENDERSKVEALRQEEEEKECLEMATTLANACVALEQYLETENGKILPKLSSLYQQEAAADAKARSRAQLGGDRGTKRPIAGGMATPALEAVDATLAAKKRLKVSAEGSSPASIADSVSPMSTPGSLQSRSTLFGGTEQDGLSGFTQKKSPRPWETSSSSPSPDVAAMLAKNALTTSSHYLDQAQHGYNQSNLSTSGAAGVNSTSTSTQSALSMPALQQAKVNNPLWSPALGLSYSIQQSTKYGHLITTEIERWLMFLAQSNGAVFTERLVGLIKAVYPTDQKFLLDYVLIELMSLDGQGNASSSHAAGAGGGAQDLLEDIDPRTTLLTALATPMGGPTSLAGSERGFSQGLDAVKRRLAQKANTREWLVETIMSALIGLVIKPEETGAWVEAGSTKWSDLIEISPVEDDAIPGGTGGGTLTSSTNEPALDGSAAAKGKKKRLRSLYNRRVSPFYATLSIFQAKKNTATRISGMYYLSAEDILMASKETSEALAEQRKQQELLFQQQQILADQSKMDRQLKDMDMDDPNLLTLKGGRKGRKIRRRHMSLQPKRMDMGPGGQQRQRLDPHGRYKQEEYSLQQLHQQQHQQQRRASRHEMENNHEGGDHFREGSHPVIPKSLAADDKQGVRDIPEVAPWVIDVKPVAPLLDGHDGADVGMAQARREDHDHEGAEDHDHEMYSQQKQQSHGADNEDGWIEEISDEKSLILAKEAGAGRQSCNAPFGVLMLILKNLTRMNQGAALDTWITDAVSGTVHSLQVWYFEWLLAHLVPAQSILPEMALEQEQELEQGSTLDNELPGGRDSYREQLRRQRRILVATQQEIWRLFKVLVAAAGIGHDPARAALTTIATKAGLLKTLENVKKDSRKDGSSQEEGGVSTGAGTATSEGVSVWDMATQLLLVDTIEASTQAQTIVSSEK
ncbi:hypothetical protein BGZ94_001298 [Podila epigama]|nr:hypothetical protein BGZ94_001298 [Podila epigama]